MQIYIDPTATVHPTAKISPGAWIGPNVIVEAHAHIGHYAIIGGPPEHRDYYDGTKPTKGVLIKFGARIFEFVTIQAGTVRRTTIGQNTAVFNKSHVAHDCVLGDAVTIGGQVSLAGHCTIMDGANISGKSCLVQRCVVGAYAFLGGFAFLTKHLPPGEKWLGIPSRFIGHNDVGLQRAGLTLEALLNHYEEDYNKLTKESVI